MTVQPMGFALAFAAGLGIGAFYFTGLWWTVQRLDRVRQPAAWVTMSFLLRAGLSLLGFYTLLRGGWPLLPAGLAGFIAVRMISVRRLRPHSEAAGVQSRRNPESAASPSTLREK
ncbi:MAG: ATP synthase subunit I [Desulfobacteraceae bacterium]